MNEREKSAQDQGKSSQSSENSASPGQTWMVHHAGKQYGPHTREELNSMLASGMLDDSAQVWTEGWERWKPIGVICSPGQAATPIRYASPAARRVSGGLSKAKFMLTEYRRRVGHRSFIFQMWLLLWTVLYSTWIVSMIIAVGSNAPTVPPPLPGFVAPPSPFASLNPVASLTSNWVCFLVGWGIVGLPVGIAAVATLENNSKV